MRSDEVLAGLLETPKKVSSKYLYDARGSRLFEEITGTEEYYPTRVEAEILSRHAEEIAERLGRGTLLIEPGAGSGRKTEILLEKLVAPAGYVPIDVSGEALADAARRIERRFPALAVTPARADFTESIPVPPELEGRRVVFFPGSTIGNFVPAEAEELLRRFGRVAGEGGAALLGVDLKKDAAVLERAYNDRRGVTAEFNLNLLRRLNREFGADFHPRAFRHRAFYDEAEGRIEMQLVSGAGQSVRLDGRVIEFGPGEIVRTEVSYKYAPEEFERLAARAGFRAERRWSDPRGWFALFLLVPHGS